MCQRIYCSTDRVMRPKDQKLLNSADRVMRQCEIKSDMGSLVDIFFLHTFFFLHTLFFSYIHLFHNDLLFAKQKEIH